MSTQEQKEEILRESLHNLIYFGRAFLPNDFLKKSDSPPFHYSVGEKLLSTSPGQRICNIIPRGHGKSILMKAAILHKILFAAQGQQQFIAWISEEQGQAIDHIRYIKHHLEYNPMIRYYFGDLAGDSVGKRWTEKDFITANGHRIIAKGTTQRLRGRSEIDVRYTGIVLDDFESELNTKTPERRSEIKSWLVSTVYPSLEETPGQEGWIWLSGTIVHYDSFLQDVYNGYRKAIDDNQPYAWDVTFLRAFDEEGLPIWASQFSKKKLEIKRREFIAASKPHKFAQEYLNDARDIANAAFKIERIHNYFGHVKAISGFNYLITEQRAIPINVYIGVDVAASATSESDYQAILVLGIDADRNRYVLDYWRERIPTFDVAEKIVEMAKRYTPVKRVTIETVQAQEMVRDMAERLSVKERRLMPGLMKGVKPPPGLKKKIAMKLPWVILLMVVNYSCKKRQ